MAYVVFGNGTQYSAAELKAKLRKSLPDYMVPAHFVELEEMPQTPNGKVDRKALPAPGGDSLAKTQEFVAPSSPVEEKLASIWRDLLRLDQIGVDDNFFDAGGHSLTAVRLVARVREAFGVDMTLRTAFDAPTIAELATVVDAGAGKPPDPMGDEQVDLLI